MDKDHNNKQLHIRSAPVANVVIAKGIRTPLLPVMARPVHVAPALALAADPAPVEILQAARPRAARRRDEAVAPRAGILARVLWRREDGGGRTGRVLVRRRVDGRRRAVRVSRHQAGRVRAGELVVVVDERVLAHASLSRAVRPRRIWVWHRISGRKRGGEPRPAETAESVRGGLGIGVAQRLRGSSRHNACFCSAARNGFEQTTMW
ncbi:hypothetical protein V8C44DRAFT_52931 [Trichoderma aethiopicum]